MSRCGTQFKPTIEIDDLKELANERVLDICAKILPNGRDNCGYWEVGSIEGEPGQSLKINLRGATRGLWTDFAAPNGAPDRQGNIIQLVAQVECGGSVGRACAWLRHYLGFDRELTLEELGGMKAKATRLAAKAQEDAIARAEKNRRRAHELYLNAEPYVGTPAEIYLKSRAIDFVGAGLKPPGVIRFRPDVYCAETRSKMPAMLASIVHMDGRHLGTHRTWIQPSGKGKATLLEPKKSIGKFTGGFIPLWKGEHRCSMKDLPPGVPIFISEGIEDGLSAVLAKPSIRCIAGVSVSNIGGLELPVHSPIHILAQRDEKMRAIEAFGRSVERLQAKGHKVFLIYPPEGVKDYNDLLRDGAARGGGK